MRINEIGTLPVTQPDARTEIDATRPVRAVQPIAEGAREESERRLPTPLPVEPAGPPNGQERRQGERRVEDRRKRQVPVLIDTRVAERRTGRRREDDPPPPAVDLEA
ncbi:MAG TPA: hypothetical protein VFA81_09765 [Burkholderiales bacterium]|nr:hypothetical protein [Burkholderiales bacterium]